MMRKPRMPDTRAVTHGPRATAPETDCGMKDGSRRSNARRLQLTIPQSLLAVPGYGQTLRSGPTPEMRAQGHPPHAEWYDVTVAVRR